MTSLIVNIALLFYNLTDLVLQSLSNNMLPSTSIQNNTLAPVSFPTLTC